MGLQLLNWILSSALKQFSSTKIPKCTAAVADAQRHLFNCPHTIKQSPVCNLQNSLEWKIKTLGQGK